MVRENRRGRGETIAVVDGDQRFTYTQFDDRTDRLAHALQSEGVRPGDRVLWLGANSHRILELLVAAGKVGAVLCPANWRQSVAELRFVIDDLAPKVIVSEPATMGAVHEPLNDGTAVWISSAQGPEDEYERWLTSYSPEYAPVDVSDRDAVLLLYTAAFDGHPNGALLSHRGLIAHALVLATQRQIEEGFVFLDSGPLFHVGTMMFAVATVLCGGTNVILPQFDPRVACELIERERCTGAMLFPAMIDQLVAANGDDRFDLTSLHFAPGNSTWNHMISIDYSPWGRSNAGYGQTEVGGMLTFHAFGIGGTGTHGRSSPLMQLRIIDPEGQEVPAGEVGEITTRGMHLFNGYFNRPELNAARFRDGWYFTGDLGRRETDGTVSFVGPKLRMIKSGGENIYPAEVERALLAHPDVSDAAVIGRPDKVWGQSVVAIVVRSAATAVSEEELIAHVRTHIASYKKPKFVVFVDAIPRRGFLADYDVLDELHGGGGYPGGGETDLATREPIETHR
ncbi:AMP-binding protein [Rhodococcus sp. T2V]|uniref:AMP-binding protein n=1 Tax=Rhodococcus sp. T2V TaxID=3034164 RepID=UPI0023E2013A|nr:AMP-binding protein [Rhodococcus sp. T2V]